MSPLTAILRDRILAQGPIPFSAFMRAALYEPGLGYYRRGRDPFGKGGDYYTAEQLQPVYGRLIGSLIRQMLIEQGDPDPLVVELGAGRGEMAEAFEHLKYIPVDTDHGRLPEHFHGVLFANEFFDALPVDVARRQAETFQGMYVDWQEGRFAWVEGGALPPEQQAYVEDYVPPAAGDLWLEVCPEAREWLQRIDRSLASGRVLIIDYGYRASELARLTRGTLMSYRRHQAVEDVLQHPGEQDITAHVCFTALADWARDLGWQVEWDEPLSSTLLRAGERDQFAAALRASSPSEEQRLRLQLKTLLFGMGEMFRVLLLRKM